MENVDLDHILESNLRNLGRNFPEFKDIGAFDKNIYSFEFLPDSIAGYYNRKEDIIAINPFIPDSSIESYRNQLFDTIIHEESHHIESKFNKAPFKNQSYPHSVYWFGIYKMLGGTLNGFYTKSSGNKDKFIGFYDFNYSRELVHRLDISYDNKVRLLASNLKNVLLDSVLNAIVVDLSGVNGDEGSFITEISSSISDNLIVMFDKNAGFKIIGKGAPAVIKINYDVENLKSWVEYI
ncbi:MAG: hypothetical protein QXL94_03470 [Candidatus Parvarchaeum sp.]